MGGNVHLAKRYIFTMTDACAEFCEIPNSPVGAGTLTHGLCFLFAFQTRIQSTTGP